VRTVFGEVAFHQARPDDPRLKDDKPVKYEQPTGARMVLDVHPASLADLANPQVPVPPTATCCWTSLPPSAASHNVAPETLRKRAAG
jgi:hypothetical protein